MNYFYNLINLLVMKAYFYLIGDEEIARILGDKIEIRTKIDDQLYDCVCQEIVFRVQAAKLIKVYKTNRLYKVTMQLVGDAKPTYGTYPVLCPNGFVMTGYPHMLAIKCHHRLFYC